MNPKKLFLIVLGAGLAGVLVAFFFMRMENTDKLNEPAPKVTTPVTSKPLPKKETTTQDPIILEELVADEKDDTPDTSDAEDSTDTKPTTTDTSEKETTSPTSTTPSPDSDTSSPAQTNTDTSSESDIAVRMKTEKVTHYYNESLSYGMLVPYSNYYSGFGPADGARHTVGYSTGAIPDTLEDAQVQVYFYGQTVLPELKNTNQYTDPTTGDIYLKLANEFSVKIVAEDPDSETLKMILDTIYVGPSQEPESEDEEDSTQDA